LLGYYVTGHPMDQFKDKVLDLRTHTSSTLEGLAKGFEVKLCGLMTGIQRKRNRDGKPWVAMQLEDWDGAVEAVVFPKAYEQMASLIVEDRAVLIRATALPEEGGPPKVSVQDVIPLENARVNLASLIGIRIRLGMNGNSKAEALRELFARKPGEAQVRLRLEKMRDFSVTLDVTARVKPDKEFRAEVERICGPDSLESL